MIGFLKKRVVRRTHNGLKSHKCGIQLSLVLLSNVSESGVMLFFYTSSTDFCLSHADNDKRAKHHMLQGDCIKTDVLWMEEKYIQNDALMICNKGDLIAK